ncbi:MAG: hypothetical protein EPO02_06340 [Nitrospirae bacterium]|nr:MAG: hypothetical protein EPO02_06340 [Nitrospirota bacterium]
MARKWLVVMCSMVLLTGCKTEPEHWVPTGKTDTEATQALAACKNMASPEPVPFTEPVYMLPDEHVIVRCMEAYGYTLATGDSHQPQGNTRAINEAQLDRLQ